MLGRAATLIMGRLNAVPDPSASVRRSFFVVLPSRQFSRQRRGDVAGGAFEEDQTDEAGSALEGGGRRVGMVDAADLELNAHASSSTMLRAAEAGSDAWVIGRPMTR